MTEGSPGSLYPEFFSLVEWCSGPGERITILASYCPGVCEDDLINASKLSLLPFGKYVQSPLEIMIDRSG